MHRRKLPLKKIISKKIIWFEPLEQVHPLALCHCMDTHCDQSRLVGKVVTHNSQGR